MREISTNQGLTCDLPCNFIFYPKPEMIPGSIRTFWYQRFAKNNAKHKVRKKAYMSQKQQPKTQSLIFQKNKY